MIFYYLLRSDIEESREINKHGHTVTIDNKDEETNDAKEEANKKNEESNDPSVDAEAYDKDLVSRNEKTQDHAMKELYKEYEAGVVKKQKMLNFCLNLGHKVNF